MPTGSCLCGNVKLSYDDQPVVKALCHCADCKKISGGLSSINSVIKADSFKSSGSPKEYVKTSDGGARIVSYFCGDCGTTLWRETPTFEGMKIIKAGVFDDKKDLDNLKPDIELYAPERVSWVPQTQGTEDKQGMS